MHIVDKSALCEGRDDAILVEGVDRRDMLREPEPIES